MQDSFVAGLQLFNTRKFFEAHEALEAVWLRERGEEKIFLQGLIQIAAAFHHYSRRNSKGAQSLLEAGWEKLVVSGDKKRGVDLAGLRNQLQPWRDFLAGQASQGPAAPAATPPLPQIEVTDLR